MFFDRPFVAIDIGSSSVKIIEMTGGADKKLRAIGLEVLPPGAVVDGAIQEIDIVEEAVKKLIKRLNISTTGRRAAISLSGSSLLIKRVGFAPSSDEAEMHEQIYYEAEQHFQHDIDELYFDYFATTDEQNHEGLLPFLLVGAKRDMVEQYISLVRSIGMRIGVIDCDVFSSSNMLEHNYGVTDGLIGIVNIGASVSQVSIIYRGEYIYTRDIALAGEHYTQRISDNLSIDQENAESMKVSVSQGDGDVPENLNNVLQEVNSQLVTEIKMTLDYFFQSGEAPPEAQKIDQIFLSGGASKTLGLDATVASTLQIPVRIANPFHRVDINPKTFQMDYILSQGHLYSVAVGLALRNIKEAAKKAG
jgi:type IV pilus assembly protein PilM